MDFEALKTKLYEFDALREDWAFVAVPHPKTVADFESLGAVHELECFNDVSWRQRPWLQLAVY